MKMRLKRWMLVGVLGVSLLGQANGTEIGIDTRNLPPERLQALRKLIVSSSQSRIAQVKRVVEAYQKETGMVGCSIAIGERGKIVFESGFGLADLEHGAKAKPETIYRLASISKSMTAIGVMKLVEAGKVDLDKDLCDYVPELPRKEHPFTVRQVLAHTSGIRHYKLTEPLSMKRYRNVEESLGMFKDDPLTFKPGDKMGYSTHAYTALAKLIENVSGMSFPEYMKKEVFDPAGAKTTFVEDINAVVPNRARGYRKGEDGKPINSVYTDISYKWAGGGMVSSASDLCRVGMALLNGKLLNEQSKKRMWTAYTLNDGKKTSYGLGWEIRQYNNKLMVSHGGSQPSARTYLNVLPEDQIVIVVLTNYESHPVPELIKRIREAWLPPIKPSLN